MKRCLVVFVLLVLDFLFYGFAFAKDWQPISEITDSEINIIEHATRKTSDSVLKDAESFTMSSNIVMIRFKDGSLGMYGTNVRFNKSSLAITKKSSEDHDYTNNPGRLPGNYEKPRTEKIFDRFLEIWNAKSDPNGLTDRELAEADALADECIKIAFRDQNQAPLPIFITEVFMRRGNRYINLLEPFIPTFEIWEQISLWDNYMRSYSARAEDLPTDEEKIGLINNKLYELLINYKKEGHPLFAPTYTGYFYNIGEEIKRLTPRIYNSLIEIDQKENQ